MKAHVVPCEWPLVLVCNLTTAATPWHLFIWLSYTKSLVDKIDLVRLSPKTGSNHHLTNMSTPCWTTNMSVSHYVSRTFDVIVIESRVLKAIECVQASLCTEHHFKQTQEHCRVLHWRPKTRA